MSEEERTIDSPEFVGAAGAFLKSVIIYHETTGEIPQRLIDEIKELLAKEVEYRFEVGR